MWLFGRCWCTKLKASTRPACVTNFDLSLLYAHSHIEIVELLFIGTRDDTTPRNSRLRRLWPMAILGGICLPLPVRCSVSRQVWTAYCYSLSLHSDLYSVVARTVDKLATLLLSCACYAMHCICFRFSQNGKTRTRFTTYRVFAMPPYLHPRWPATSLRFLRIDINEMFNSVFVTLMELYSHLPFLFSTPSS